MKENEQDHPLMMINCYNHFALLKRYQAKFDDARKVCQEAFELASEHEGCDKSLEISRIYQVLAWVCDE